jgi:hypothetical protein
MTQYAMVTVISTFRNRYVIPVDHLQTLNTDVPIEGLELEWAEDCVTCEDLYEFSQKHLGETIIDSELLDEDKILELFDKDNDYLKDWSKEQKLQWIINQVIDKKYG